VYQKFIQYYGDEQYADKYILAASFGNATSFSSQRGDADFQGSLKLAKGKFCSSSSQSLSCRIRLNFSLHQAEAFLVGIQALSVFMQVVVEMHRSLDVCKKSCKEKYCIGDGHLNAWDKAVAFFCGSLSDEADGLLLFALTKRRHQEFHKQTEDIPVDGLSKQIIDQFSRAQIELSQGDCAAAEKRAHAIFDKMRVPLVQSVIRYAYILEQDDFSDLADRQKANALGATYASSLLPFLHHCNENVAETIYQQMGYGFPTPSFEKVKRSLESQYSCMNTSCEEVGGLLVGDDYAENARPCESRSALATNGGNPGKAGAAVLGAALAIAALGLAVFVFLTKQKKSQQSRLSAQSNIASVSDLA